MKGRILTWDDLNNYFLNIAHVYSYDSNDNQGSPLVFQTEGILKTDPSEVYEGLTPVTLQACHTDRNLNSSSISLEVMTNRMLPTFKNRPILGYIHKVDDNFEFYGHNAHLEDGKIVYDEIPVGVIPESNEATLKYDEEKNRYHVCVKGFIFDEYTEAKNILERDGELAVSVEIAIKKMSYNTDDQCLVIEDGYFSGITILGKDENGNKVMPGMENSNITMADFQSNVSDDNEVFDQNDFNKKIMNALDELKNTLSQLNINSTNNTQEGGISPMTKFEELLNTYNVSEEDITFEYESLSDEELEAKFEEMFAKCGDKKKKCSEDGTEDEDPEEPESTEDPEDPEGEREGEEEPEDEQFSNNEPEMESYEAVVDGIKYSVSFELSHETIRSKIYRFLAKKECMDDTYYYITSVFSDYFICCQSGEEKYFAHKYTINENDEVEFVGDFYEVFPSFITAEEKEAIETMKSNYSSIEAELNTYKEKESFAEKMAIFADEDYKEFLEEPEFKELMKEETMKAFTKEELDDKANIVFSKLVKKKKSLSTKAQEPTNNQGVVFGTFEKKTNFLDGLLNK